MRNYKVGPIALRYVQNLRGQFDARGRHGKSAQFETFGLLQVLDDRQRLLARRIVIIDVGDFLALQITAQLSLANLTAAAPWEK